MPINLRRCWTALLLTGCTFVAPALVLGQEPWVPGGIEVLGDGLEFQDDNPFRLASQVERSTQPLDSPLQPLDSPLQPLESPALAGDLASPSFALPAELRQALALDTQPTADVVTQGQAQTVNATDLGSVLQQSDNVQTVNTQRRSQVGFDPHVRGYKFGQIYTQAAGEYFLPVRQDLDTMLNKIDPSLIQTMTVIPGPYGLRYGPGFSFIDIVTIDTPRSDCGFQWNNRFGVSARGNGGQIYGRDTVMGGAENYGFIAHFDIKSGSDYEAGNGQRIPSSYHTQNAMLQLGFDLSQDSRVEVGYSRLDIRDTEYALQFFDVNALATDSFNLRYVQDDVSTGGVTVGQVWYNQTRFSGDNLNGSKFEIRERVAQGLNNDFFNNPGGSGGLRFTADSFRAFTNGTLTSLGGRAYRVIGEETGENLRVGADFRQITQSTNEQFLIRDPAGVPGPGGILTPGREDFTTNQPHSVLADPGLFSEWTTPWTSYVKTTVGGRVDWAHTYPRVADYDGSFLVPGVSDVGFEQNDLLLAGYGSGEVELTECWSLRGGVGYAERTPDLLNRYADGVFVGVLQNGFSRIVGLPSLQKERATQADVSAVADYGWVTGRASYFYSWINDYNTYTAFAFDPTGAQILLAQNTPLATLNGFEWNVDYHVDDITTLFVNMMYVEGTDRGINRPLPQIYPLQSRAGLRWEEPSDDNIWGFEWGFRFVARQNRIGFLRDTLTSVTSTTPVETPTPGFTTSYVRGYYNLTSQLHLIGGIDNLFDRTYIEHLDLRLSGAPVTPNGVTAVLSPGFTAYAGLEWEI
jgi:iron complex outermembrane receptor protein